MRFPALNWRGRRQGASRCPPAGNPARRLSRALTCALSLILTAGLAGPAPAATEEELEAARERRERLQQQLDETVAAYDAAQTELATTQASMERNRAQLQELQEVADQAQSRLTRRANEVYRQGPGSIFEFLIGAQSFSDLGRRMKLLQEASEQDATIIQEAEIAQARVNRLQADLAGQETKEQQILDSMEAQAESLNADFAQAQQLETRLAADRTEAERLAQQREAEQRAAAQRAAEQEAEAAPATPSPSPRAGAAATRSPIPTPSPSPRPSPSPSPAEEGSSRSSSGMHCPVDGPVSFTDTYGHPRSGGRSHQGVDMFAAMGTPVAAITDGSITRRSSSTLGGLYIYFTGSDGTEYFYTHLSGYSDVPVGRRIDGGTHIGYVGNTGNARGTPPHLHFEVAPPNRGTINPTPTARRACGR